MPEIFAQPLSPTCYRLFPDPGIAEFQWLGSGPFLPRARTREAPHSDLPRACAREAPHSERLRLVCDKGGTRGQRACARQN